MEAQTISVDEARKRWNERRILAMAGLGRGLEVGPKTLFKSNTALQSSPSFFAYAFYPRMSKAEAMQRMMDRFG